jgi:hypothetical protein
MNSFCCDIVSLGGSGIISDSSNRCALPLDSMYFLGIEGLDESDFHWGFSMHPEFQWSYRLGGKFQMIGALKSEECVL